MWKLRLLILELIFSKYKLTPELAIFYKMNKKFSIDEKKKYAFLTVAHLEAT